MSKELQCVILFNSLQECLVNLVFKYLYWSEISCVCVVIVACVAVCFSDARLNAQQPSISVSRFMCLNFCPEIYLSSDQLLG